MIEENAPSSVTSPQGRRVLVAVVTGDPGERIQQWREKHDPDQAHRLPPHTTLCYWVPALDPSVLERQVRHAFSEPVGVALGGVREFDNDQRTFYVEVMETEALNASRRRLYDGTFVELAGFREWDWHVTCVRESLGRDVDRLCECARDLRIDAPWAINEVAFMELQGSSTRRSLGGEFDHARSCLPHRPRQHAGRPR